MSRVEILTHRRTAAAAGRRNEAEPDVSTSYVESMRQTCIHKLAHQLQLVMSAGAFFSTENSMFAGKGFYVVCSPLFKPVVSFRCAGFSYLSPGTSLSRSLSYVFFPKYQHSGRQNYLKPPRARPPGHKIGRPNLNSTPPL